MDQLIKYYINYAGIALVLLLSSSLTAQKTSLTPVNLPEIKRNGYVGGLSVQVQVIPPDGTIALQGKSTDFEVISDKETLEKDRYRINLKIKNSSKDDKVKWVIRKDDIISSRYLRPNNLPVAECRSIPFENNLLISYLIKGEATDGRAPLKLKLWLLHINNDCPQAAQQPYVLSINYQIKTKKRFIPEPPPVVAKVEEVAPREVKKPIRTEPKTTSQVIALDEKEEWRKTEEKNSVKAYEAFITQFPDSDLTETAKLRKEPITYALKKTDDPLVWEVQLKNTIQPFVRFDTASEITVIEKTPEAFTVILPYLYKEYDLKIIDEDKAVGQQIMAITLHPEAEPIDVHVDSLETDSLLITITGGTKPYLITLKDTSDHTIVVTSNLGDSTYAFIVPVERERLSLRPGKYTFNVVDKGWQEPSEITGRQVVTVEPVYLPWDYIITIGGVFIALLALLSVIRSARKRRKRRKMEAGKEKIMEQLVNMEQEPEFTLTEYAEQEEALEQTTAAVEVKNKIKIKGIKKRQEQIIEIRGGDFYANSGQYFALYMEQLWQDSVIEKLFFSKESIRDLDEFVQTQNLLIFDENESGIPEIGGLLIGKVGKEAYSGVYQVAIEKFEPIKASFQNTIRLEYSVEDLARVFGEMDDKHPDLTLVGWFHTHPGHGLFLSQPDLVIQNNYFDKPFQFAMEMDTKTQRLDTGFFTWKKANQGINNTKNLKTGTAWFSWTELEQFV